MEDYKKKYEEVLEKAKSFTKRWECVVLKEVKEIFPELEENSDERIRKALLAHFNQLPKHGYLTGSNTTFDEAIAWLEKQGEQGDNKDESILHRFSFYSYKDEPNVLYLSNVFVNEKYRNKGIGTKILEVVDEVAKSLNCHAIRLKTKKGSNAERLYQTHGYNSLATEGRDEIWLEKQGEQKASYTTLVETGDGGINALVTKELHTDGEQKPVDKVEPKFKVGDWVIFDNHHKRIFQVEKIENCRYFLRHYLGGTMSVHFDNELIRQWTIQDAKDGDVLYINNTMSESIMIYKLFNNGIINKYASYNKFGFEGENYLTLNNGYIIPTTKEQRDLLFQKMNEAGFEWDAEKKELKKIGQNIVVKQPNGGIVREDFNGGDGFYKVELGYLSKLQVEDIERLVVTWQIPNYDRVEDCISNILADAPNDRFEDFKTNLRDCLNCVRFSKLREWSEEDKQMMQDIISGLEAEITWLYKFDEQGKATMRERIDWLKSIKQRIQKGE